MIAGDLIERYGEEVVDARRVFTIQVGAPGPGGSSTGKSIEVQYDPYNRRLKFFDLTPENVRDSMAISSTFDNDSDHGLYSKIIVYARPGQDAYQEMGLRREAVIRGFFRNGDNAELWARYLDDDRATEHDRETNEKVYEIAASKQVMTDFALPQGYTSAPATLKHAPEIAALMGDTFTDYPTPITVEVIEKNIRERTSAFRIVRNEKGEMVACASAEIHHTRRSAEMTDCSTRPDQRGKGLMTWILHALEEDLKDQFGITDVYTIARAVEIGMNCSFAKLGYEYTGRLINNCRMNAESVGAEGAHRAPGTGWESMNVWCKSTQDTGE